MGGRQPATRAVRGMPGVRVTRAEARAGVRARGRRLARARRARRAR